MYAVVGCSECDALWVVEGRPETSGCPQCGTTRQHAKRRKFVSTDDPDHAREVRAALLAERQGYGDDFADLDSFAEMDDVLDEAGVTDEEFLEGAGIDPEPVAEAGERARTATGSKASRKETVLAAFAALDEPTEADVVAYADERGVPETYARNALDKLERAGEITERDGVYRRL